MADSTAAARGEAGIRAARALGDSRNYRGAAEALRRVLGEDPDHVEAQYLLGLYLHNLGRHVEAVAACRAAVALDPENAIAHRLLGIVLGGAVFSKVKGLAHLDQAVRLAPTDGFNHYFRAKALVGLARPRKARIAFFDACERAPTEAFILAGTAEFLFSTYRVKEARDLAARALAADPDDLGALTAEARSRLLAGRAADARDLARAAVALNASNRAAIEVLIEAEMCRNPAFAVWSRLKSWCRGGSWRASFLLIGGSWAMATLVITVVALIPDVPYAGLLVFAVCIVAAALPNVIHRRRVAAALRPAALRRGY